MPGLDQPLPAPPAPPAPVAPQPVAPSGQAGPSGVPPPGPLEGFKEGKRKLPSSFSSARDRAKGTGKHKRTFEKKPPASTIKETFDRADAGEPVRGSRPGDTDVQTAYRVAIQVLGMLLGWLKPTLIEAQSRFGKGAVENQLYILLSELMDDLINRTGALPDVIRLVDLTNIQDRLLALSRDFEGTMNRKDNLGFSGALVSLRDALDDLLGRLVEQLAQLPSAPPPPPRGDGGGPPPPPPPPPSSGQVAH
jgi:hypothetical protein